MEASKIELVGNSVGREDIAQVRPSSSGSSFFITDDGYFITNEHVAGEGYEEGNGAGVGVLKPLSQTLSRWTRG